MLSPFLGRAQVELEVLLVDESSWLFCELCLLTLEASSSPSVLMQYHKHQAIRATRPPRRRMDQRWLNPSEAKKATAGEVTLWVIFEVDSE